MDLARILSIDWDYFFPDSTPYDMGNNEKFGPNVQDLLWSIRARSHNLITRELLIDAYAPIVPKNFWSRIVKGHPTVTHVADSHFRIWKLLERGVFAQVTSLDAHHDCGYGPQRKAYVDCANWGYWGRRTFRIGRLDLWYPLWRKGAVEPLGRKYKPSTIRYGLPEPAEYDIIFICRSGAWTPPWWDRKFTRFSLDAPGMSQEVMDDLKPRGISLRQARALSKTAA